MEGGASSGGTQGLVRRDRKPGRRMVGMDASAGAPFPASTASPDQVVQAQQGQSRCQTGRFAATGGYGVATGGKAAALWLPMPRCSTKQAYRAYFVAI